MGHIRSRKRVEMADRRRRVGQMYLQHVNQSDIARALGVYQSTVARDIATLKDEWRQEAISDVKDRILREAAELDDLEAACAERFEQTGQVGWVAQRLAIKDRRARLLGLDAPRRTDVNLGMPAVKLIDADAWAAL